MVIGALGTGVDDGNMATPRVASAITSLGSAIGRFASSGESNTGFNLELSFEEVVVGV